MGLIQPTELLKVLKPQWGVVSRAVALGDCRVPAEFTRTKANGQKSRINDTGCHKDES